MSQWHREHPELCGTSADPWMRNDLHRQAYDELRRFGLIYTEDDELEDDTPRPGSKHERQEER